MTTRVPERLRSVEETSNRITRVTKSGKKLHYELRVIQQPQRARACGSGAKSSADRRPVDPPPVVELRIYEGESWEKNEDVTFAYTANFFLFATLEVSRPIANARGHVQAPAPQVPVLTGMPVSGMAYLDRPTEAGYFIFPDLSVRHEGMYKLTFNLYEQVKEEDKDGDAEQGQKSAGAGMNAPDSSFDWRFEVHSKPFQVYSAKKFPGLTESTGLSRQIAEQGCRVRIRRDIRMRRRENKGGDDPYPEPEIQDYARPSRAPEQEAYDHTSPRSRSSSSGSEGDPRSPFRGQNDNGEFHAPGQHPQYPPGPRQNLAWMDAGHSGPAQYQTPAPPQYTAPAPQQPYQAGANAYPPGPPSYRPVPPPSNFGYEREYPQSAYPSNPPREREPEPEWRRASHPAAHSQPSHYPSVDSSFARPSHTFQQQQRPHTPGFPSVSLAPIKMPSETRHEAIKPSPLPPVSRTIPSLPSVYDRPPQERANSYSQYTAPAPAPLEPRTGKRSFDAVFAGSAAAVNQPLHNGMRPTSAHASQVFDDDDDAEIEMSAMSYKRADGITQTRLPPQSG